MNVDTVIVPKWLISKCIRWMKSVVHGSCRKINLLSKNIDTNIKVICTMKAPLSSFIHDEFHFNCCKTYSQLWGANSRWHNGKTISHTKRMNGSIKTFSL